MLACRVKPGAHTQTGGNPYELRNYSYQSTTVHF
jgi:hypothetical protein